jgi:2-C-methyl-D-erythritol 2,4-cyclodiphosphate synthase
MLRIGSSMDIHRLEPKRKLILGGITIKSNLGTIAHSDGDVVFHALVEAIFGALAIGDLGDHFPSSSQKYKNYDSEKFLIVAKKHLKQQKCKVNNIDISIILETPKLSNYKLKIRKNIAKILDVALNQVSVKAGTMEKIGEIGAGQAVMALATVLIEKEG